MSTYTVSIELANPYPTPIAVRVFDPYPLTTAPELETKRIDSKPVATRDAVNAGLEWRLTVATNQKQTISFAYSIKRPQGWKMSQSETSR